MASQVLSGSGNFSYTNNTGQNVRVIINYFSGNTFSYSTTMSWAGTTITLPQGSDLIFGRNLAFYNSTSTFGTVIANNMIGPNYGGVPTEIMLSAGQTFSISATSSTAIDAYNIVVIPEAG